MKYFIFALALAAYAQSMPPPSANASTLRGKQPCPTTASTNCIPLVDSSGNISVPGSISAGSTGAIDLTAITAPATPAAGIGSVFVDSTSKNLTVKDDAGVVKHGVQTKAAVTNQLVSAIADDGTVTTRALAADDLPATPLITPGTSITLVGPRAYAICTGTCTVTVPVPVAGYEFCIMNDNNVATAITLSALGSSAMYENSARTAYGTAGTGTLVLSAAAANRVCIVGRDSTHYLTVSYNGTVTVD